MNSVNKTLLTFSIKLVQAFFQIFNTILKTFNGIKLMRNMQHHPSIFTKTKQKRVKTDNATSQPKMKDKKTIFRTSGIIHKFLHHFALQNEDFNYENI
jgi:hypothetical protein